MLLSKTSKVLLNRPRRKRVATMELGQVLILGSMLGKQKSALSNPYCGLQDTPISVVICPKFTRKSPMAS